MGGPVDPAVRSALAAVARSPATPGSVYRFHYLSTRGIVRASIAEGMSADDVRRGVPAAWAALPGRAPDELADAVVARAVADELAGVPIAD